MKTFFSLILGFGLFSSYAQSYKVEIDEIPYDTLKEYQSMVLENIENDVSVAPLKAVEFNNISGRAGINVKKDMGSRGHLNFYIHGIFPVGNQMN